MTEWMRWRGTAVVIFVVYVTVGTVLSPLNASAPILFGLVGGACAGLFWWIGGLPE